MSKRKAVVTIVANNYLASAVTLCDSLKKNDNLDLYIVLVDGKLDTIDYTKYSYNILEAQQMNIPRFYEMAYKYNVVEFSTALKPFALDYLIDKYESVYYVDPDICFFESFDNVEQQLGEHTAILTPHLVDGRNEQWDDSVATTCMRCGVYNLGFIGVNNCDEGKALLKWWKERLTDFCYNNMIFYTDQKWANIMPALFNDVYISKDIGFNVAEWNLSERNIVYEQEKYWVYNKREKRPLSFYHFSSYKATNPAEFLKRAGCNIWENSIEVMEQLYGEYKQCLDNNEFGLLSKSIYKYNYYDNGVVITDIQRRIYKALLKKGYQYNGLFSTDKASLYYLLKKNGILSFEKENVRIENSISEDGKYKRLVLLNKIMRVAKHVMGIKKYNMLLLYFNIYCTPDQQIFLLKDMKDEIQDTVYQG